MILCRLFWRWGDYCTLLVGIALGGLLWGSRGANSSAEGLPTLSLRLEKSGSTNSSSSHRPASHSMHTERNSLLPPPPPVRHLTEVRRISPRELQAKKAFLLPLLNHSGLLTLTLERFFGRVGLVLDVLCKEHDEASDVYRRQILMQYENGPGGNSSSESLGAENVPEYPLVVSFGSIEIDLGALRPEVREAVLEERMPFGRILAEFGVLSRVQLESLIEADYNASEFRSFESLFRLTNSSSPSTSCGGVTEESKGRGEKGVLKSFPPADSLRRGTGEGEGVQDDHEDPEFSSFFDAAAVGERGENRQKAQEETGWEEGRLFGRRVTIVCDGVPAVRVFELLNTAAIESRLRSVSVGLSAEELPSPTPSSSSSDRLSPPSEEESDLLHGGGDPSVSSASTRSSEGGATGTGFVLRSPSPSTVLKGGKDRPR
uniref:Uncharacterized protein n=1 Tax=Chromera velia CCMP2878 TaxID=1169474 RepID=A0A0G4FTQ6_9ALVE|eukprot:Cvel_18583.t1-p1 / transcript=Cvel_18583.t1 / gene=Cvel_18583 / organism=Chromera_velia_CCMP2878 / gene_product=hypothetical protein / transcript_product=hypothetical protein / location=Cvel_scaffold1550:19052-20341(-) / protein_length=430 / sequence_SO=supercontig / SO=protein_coding / is_pseudo=false